MGSALSFHVPGIVEIIKNIANAPAEIAMKKNEAEIKKLEVLSKRLEVYNKLKSSGINPEDLQQHLNTLNKCTQSLETKPIVLEENSSTPSQGDATSVKTEPEDAQ